MTSHLDSLINAAVVATVALSGALLRHGLAPEDGWTSFAVGLAFFGGMALGIFAWKGRRRNRLSSRN
jgi:hypothetical protein